MIDNPEAVLLIRVTFDGEIFQHWLSPGEAVTLARHDPDNGREWFRAWIVADGVNMGLWDRSA